MYEYIDTFATWQGWMQKMEIMKALILFWKSTYIQEHC